MLAQVRRDLAALAMRAVFGAIGGAMLVTGSVFLIAAATIALALSFGVVAAFLVMGLALSGVGLICIALASHRRRRPSLPPPPVQRQAALVDAFLGGLQAGRALSRRKGGR